MQTTLLGFAIALILALLAALVGPHVVNWNDHRAFFEAEASRLIGLRVRVSGDIDAGILPFPSVTLRDIAIGPDGKASRLSARSLRIELGLGPLMRGEIRATEMRLVAPQFSVGLDSQGQIDWPPLALAGETLSIDRLSIEDGRVALTDATSRSRLVLDQLWFTGEVRSLTGPFRGRGEFVMGGGLHGYDISAGRHGPDGIRLKLGLKTDQRPLTIEADGMLAFERAKPHFNGGLSLAWPAGAVLASGKAVTYEPWRLTGKVKADASSAVLADVSMQYGPDDRSATLTGSAEFKFGAQPQLQGTLAARQIDLDRLLARADGPRRLPFSAVQAFGEMLGSSPQPAWPAKLSINIDAMTLSGATLQNVSSEARWDGANWTLDKLDFRAPGFTRIKVNGRLYPSGKALGFAGGVGVDSSDPKNLVAWLTGRAATSTQIKPWRAKGEVTLGADRIAVERLRAEFERGPIEGSLAYTWPVTWPADTKPARLDADLHAADLDLDAMFNQGDVVLSSLGLERPGEVALALEVGRARIAGIDAHNIAARFTLDAEGFAIERLSIADFGDTSVTASGRIRTLASPSGNITADLNARDLNGIIALTEKFAPPLAEPLRRIAGRQKTAVLRANVSVGNSGGDGANGTFGLTGRIGTVGVNISARATGKREAFMATDLSKLTGADVHIDGSLETDEAAALLALLGLDRVNVSDKRPARLSMSANGALGRELAFEGKIDAGPIDAGGKGVIRFSSDQPAAIDLNRFEGVIGGNKVQGRLALRLGEAARVDGLIETESLDAPAIIAAAIGMPVQRGMGGAPAGWSSEPFAWSASGLTGRVEFKAQRAVFAPALVAQPLRGVARFGGSEVTFEDIAGELAKGRLEGRLAIINGVNGLSAQVRVGLTDADAGAIFANAGVPTISGRLAFNAELEGIGRSPAAFIGSLTGLGAVMLEQAALAGLNPGVFDAVTRAVERGIPTDSHRIGDFVAGELDKANLPVSRATAAIVINAGQARFRDIVIRASGADLEAATSVDLANARLNAILTLTGTAAVPGALRPVVLVTLNGPLPTPKRTIDASLLASWLTLRAVEQQSKQIDAMERASRELTPSIVLPDATGGIPADARAPALPPPINIPAASKPRSAPRAESMLPRAESTAPPAESTAPPPAMVGPPDLVGAQH